MRRAAFCRHAAAAALGCLAGPLLAQPAAPAFKLLIPATPGGGWDATGRALGQALLGSGGAASVAYDHRGGAAGAVGLAQFIDAYRGDDQALLVMGAVMLGGIIAGKPPVHLGMVTPVARLTTEHNVFAVPAASPWQSMRALLDAFARDPAAMRWGGGSRGATEHLAVAMLARALGVPTPRVNYVPFRGGGEALAALLAGSITVGGSGMSEFMPHIQSGRLRALATTAPQRLPGLAVPTLSELGLPVVLSNWRGVCGAMGLAATARDRLVHQVSHAVASREWQQALQHQGWSPAWLSGDAFGKFIEEESSTMRQTMSGLGLA